jgi:hypothetical protein
MSNIKLVNHQQAQKIYNYTNKTKMNTVEPLITDALINEHLQ